MYIGGGGCAHRGHAGLYLNKGGHSVNQSIAQQYVCHYLAAMIDAMRYDNSRVSISSRSCHLV